jgi:hypothetical protein
MVADPIVAATRRPVVASSESPKCSGRAARHPVAAVAVRQVEV